MSGSNWTGPVNAMGPLAGATFPSYPQDPSIEYGPSVSYQGYGMPDLRYPFNKDNPQIGANPAFLGGTEFCVLDALPAASNTALTTAGNAVSGTAFANVTAEAAGVSLAIPFFPFGSTNVQTAICLDFGWSTLNCTSGSTTIAPTNGSPPLYRYYVGQWIIIDAVGNSAGTIPLITQVTAVSNYATGQITVSTPPLATNSAARVGSGNQFNYLAYGNPPAIAHVPRIAGGLGAFMDPNQCVARGVGVTGVAGGAGGAVLISGWDVYGQPQSEIITATAGATTVYGTKAYKWFGSAVPQFSDANNYTVVTSDLFGYGFRSDQYEKTRNFFNATPIVGAAVSTTSAWVAGDQTSPATTATTDPRGYLQLSTRGPNGTVTATTFTNGARRLTMFQTINPANMVLANPSNPSPLFGVTPV